MKYLLDTNICIHFLKGEYGLNKKFERIGNEEFSISEITVAELLYGAENSQNINRNLMIVNEFIDNILILPIFSALRIYAKEKARLRSKGKLISDFDLLIGATALANDLIIVTRNVKEFKRLRNIKYENWID
jgi:tRNA(fMet)-specific endonuclease VapC